MPCKKFDKNQFEARLQQVLDARNFPESDGELCQLAERDEMLARDLRAAELLAAPPVVVMYPSANFADQIMSRIRAEDITELKQRNTPAWRRPSYWLGGIALATAASVAMVMAIANFGRAIPGTVDPPGANTVAAAPSTVESDVNTIAMAQKEFPTSLEDFSKRLDVREEKVAELRRGLQPLRSTLNVTIHVFRSTVPNRSHQSQQRRNEGQPSSAVFSPRWIA
jgi:hypothetical protein